MITVFTNENAGILSSFVKQSNASVIWPDRRTTGLYCCSDVMW